MDKTLELRHYPVRLELREEEGAEPVLLGHAAVFNELSEDFGGWREKIQPGAFTDAIKNGDVRALWNHDSNQVLGRQSSGTLELEEDETGLAFRIKPPDTTWLRDRLVSLRRGDVKECSFGFWTEKDEWKNSGENEQIRTIIKVRELREVSPGVTFPAYPQTDVGLEAALRSLTRWQQANEDAAEQARQAEADMVKMASRRRRLHLRELASR